MLITVIKCHMHKLMESPSKVKSRNSKFIVLIFCRIWFAKVNLSNYYVLWNIRRAESDAYKMGRIFFWLGWEREGKGSQRELRLAFRLSTIHG